MFGIAYAMGQGGGAAGNGAAGFTGFIPLILMFVIFYFLLIRPQQKKMKAHKEMITNVRRNDRIVTGGGIIGKVIKVVSSLLNYLPANHSYRVVFMRRNLHEVLASQAKMLERRGEASHTSDDELLAIAVHDQSGQPVGLAEHEPQRVGAVHQRRAPGDVPGRAAPDAPAPDRRP